MDHFERDFNLLSDPISDGMLVKLLCGSFGVNKQSMETVLKTKEKI